MGEWTGFKDGKWQHTIDVGNFIAINYKPYNGKAEFLANATARTKYIWNKCKKLLRKELKKKVLGIDAKTISTITSHKPGYIDQKHELIVGLQTDKPLKRAIKPFGGIREVEKACSAYGKCVDSDVLKVFKYRKSHNDGVYSAYSQDIRIAKRCGVITGLPDSYGRGRIIGDYRRVALYGIDALIEEKKKDFALLPIDNQHETIQLREEVFEQIKALEEIKEMAHAYGYNIAKPAKNAREAIQWTYFAYLASVKEQDGAAMSLGRMDAFFDIYIERDGLNEEKAQELIDDFTIKLRLVRHLRTREYNEIFAGDPTWVTCTLAGMIGKKHMVTKTSYRFLNTLYTLSSAPEPNITVLWSKYLPRNFKEYCTRVSIDSSSIQFENDDLMRTKFGSDYAISCCVSAMKIGKQMQFFGARCNLAKVLLLSLNRGMDEFTNTIIVPDIAPVNDKLNYEQVMDRFNKVLDWVVEKYVNAMNIIHYMHDKYYYERTQMAFHDTFVKRNMAFGIAGFSVVIDSLSAIKHAKIKAIRNKHGLTTDFEATGDFPKYGNDDDYADNIGIEIVKLFMNKLTKHKIYRNATPTLSILTITSNIMYGKKTGATPDGRKMHAPFAPGANPMHGRDSCGAIASLNSVAKIPYLYCLDGISNTFSIVPSALGNEKIKNLTALLDGYFAKNAHHLNVNVINQEILEKAMKNPEQYPGLTIRVSGYAVNFVKLSPEQQREIIARTFHDTI